MDRLAWEISNVSDDEVDLHVYDVIGDAEYGTDAAAFVRDLAGITASIINLRVNSPGGFVADGIAMYNALLNHPATINAYVEGRADSTASFLVQAADNRYIAKNAAMMIHPAHVGLMFGATEDDLRAKADQLAEETANIASIYAERTGGTTDEWLERMKANGNRGTTYRGSEAVAVGLMDGVTAAPARAAQRRVAAIAEGRIAAQTDDDIEIDTALIPPLAKAYKPPLPADFTRLVAANLRRKEAK